MRSVNFGDIPLEARRGKRGEKMSISKKNAFQEGCLGCNIGSQKNYPFLLIVLECVFCKRVSQFSMRQFASEITREWLSTTIFPSNCPVIFQESDKMGDRSWVLIEVYVCKRSASLPARNICGSVFWASRPTIRKEPACLTGNWWLEKPWAAFFGN